MPQKSAKSVKYGRIVIRGILLLLAFLMFLSLISYHPNDPNLLSKGGVGDTYSNLCGFVGANLAGLPVALAGLGAWLIPAYICWEALFQEKQKWLRRVAWLVFALSVWIFLGALETLKWFPVLGGGISEIRSGGWIGYALWPAFRKVFGPIGLPVTLVASTIISLIVIAPALMRAFGKLIANWFDERVLPRLKQLWPTSPMRFQAFIAMVQRPFLMLKLGHKPQEQPPELSVADGRDMQLLNEHQQAVEARERAERAAAEYRQSMNQTSPGLGLPTIESVNLDAIAANNPEVFFPHNQPTASVSSVHGQPFTGDLTVAPAPSPVNEPLPPSGALKDLPPPPKSRPPLVEPKITVDSHGHTVEQHPLGLSEPTPNKPLPEIPEIDRLPISSEELRHHALGPAERPELPPHSLFDPPHATIRLDKQHLEDTKALIQQKLMEFKVKGQITGMQPGPVVTVYEFSPDPGVPLSKIMGMEEDLALGLKAEKVRIDRILGKNVVGIEVPNTQREIISFSEMLDCPEFIDPSQKDGRSLLLMVLGKDLGGRPIVADLIRMPHLLIGGSTGSGKSVGVNAMICSILLRARPDEVKLIMVDPKMVELGVYEDIPHLWAPVVTDMKEAGRVLKWVVAQMEDRYRRLSLLAVRDLKQFNLKVAESGGIIDISDRTPNPKWPDRPQQLEHLPYIVVVIDELADLMMVCRSEVEESIARIAQKARAVGIHLILATQRPSVDIVTGVIKANLPARLCYRVNTKIDSRTILDLGGGEQLLGKGDALFLGPGTSRPRRIHAPLVEGDEILRLVEWLKEIGRPDYNQAIIQAMESEDGDNSNTLGDGGSNRSDDIFDRAVAVVKRERKASTSLLQRKLGIGYGKAARIIDRMEDEGLIGQDRGAGKPREVFGEE